MATPLQVKQSLNSIIPSIFGSFNELEQLIAPRDLEYIYNFPNKIVIYKLWEINLDLISIGKELNDEYQILDKNLNFIKTVYNSNDLSSDLDILKYVFNLNNGDYIHLVFKKNSKLETILVWVIKDKPRAEKQQLVNKWSSLKNQNQPTYYQTGEVTINNPSNGWVQIYSVAGDLFNVPSISQFLNNNESTLVVSSNENSIDFSPPLNRWYSIFLITDTSVELMYLTNIIGIGLQKISQTNGLVYLSLLGSLDNELEEGLDRLNTNKISITADLIPALNPVNNLILTNLLSAKTSLLDFTINQYQSRSIGLNTLVQNKQAEMNYILLDGSNSLSLLNDVLSNKTLIINESINEVEIINSVITSEKNRKELSISEII